MAGWLTQLKEHINDQQEEGWPVTSFFPDLLEKLNALGINGQEAKWLHSYLNDRHQLVEICYTKNQTLSKTLFEKARITSGVPQGSVLVGPVFFLLLTNNLPFILHDHNVCWWHGHSVLSNKSVVILLGWANTFDNNKQYCTTTNWPSTKVKIQLSKLFWPAKITT